MESLKTILTIIVILSASKQSQAETKVELILSARNLPDNEHNFIDGAPEGYVKVFHRGHDLDSYAFTGETNYVSNNNNPDWTEVFRYYVEGDGSSSQQSMKFKVYDQDFEADDYIGYVEIRMTEVMSAVGHRVERDLSPYGRGRLIVQGRINGTRSLDERFNKPPRIFTVPTQPNSISLDEAVRISPRFLQQSKRKV